MLGETSPDMLFWDRSGRRVRGMGKKVVTCVYCGMVYPEGTPTHGAAILTEHIKTCEKHPMRELERQLSSALERAEKAEQDLKEKTRAYVQSVKRVMDKSLQPVSSDIPKREIISPVAWFGGQMVNKLQQNDHKGHWHGLSIDYLQIRLMQEVQELNDALECKAQAKDIISEAVDVANFAMMIADNSTRQSVQE